MRRKAAPKVPSHVVHGPCRSRLGFVDEGAHSCAKTGACEIPDFVRPEALPAFIDDARRPRTARASQRRTRHRVPRLPRRVVPARPSAAVARRLRRRRGRLRPVPARLAHPSACTSGRSSRGSSRRSLELDAIYPVRRPARRAEPRGDGRRRPAAVALRPDRLRRVARIAGRRRGWRLRGGAADPERPTTSTTTTSRACSTVTATTSSRCR